MRQRILVCGGRDFGSVPNCFVRTAPWEDDNLPVAQAKAKAERILLTRILNAAKAKYDIECIIEGGARGADRLAKQWAEYNRVDFHSCPADWKTHGKKAGILRNQAMLDEQSPTLVIAFPGGAGTADMVRRSKAAGLKVIEVKL